MKNTKLYTVSAVDDAVNKLCDMGYDLQVIPGALIDTYVCIAPDEKHYHYVFKETYLNEWSSAYTARRYSKLPEWIINELENIA